MTDECEVREYDIDSPDMPQLFLQSWTPKTKHPVKGCILITHGISEHSECYDPLARALCQKGWLVFAWDLQGHGRSQGKRGYVRDFHDYARDLKSVIAKIKEDETLPTQNFHLIGHSMGGLITLHCLSLPQPPRVQSAIVSNPALGLSMDVPKVKELASQWLNQFWPTLTLANEVQHHKLSRDPKMVAAYGKDPLRHNKISAPLYLGMVAAMDEVKRQVNKIQPPLFFQISGKDMIVDPQASLDLYKEFNGKKTLKIYEDSYHEVYNDINKQEAIDDLLEHLGSDL